MSESFDLTTLSLPEGSEFASLIERCPDISRLLYRDGDYLMREGEDSHETFIVLQGAYVVEQGQGPGSEKRGDALAIKMVDIQAPEFIGEMAYLGSTKRSASVRCSGAVYTLCLEPAHVDTIIDEFPILARTLSKQLSLRLKEADVSIRTYREQLSMDASNVFKEPGQEIVMKGEPAVTLFQLVDGIVTMESSAGVKTVSPTQTPDDFLNARAFFSRRKNEATIRAKTNCILAAIDGASRLAVIRNYPEIVENLVEGPG